MLSLALPVVSLAVSSATATPKSNKNEANSCSNLVARLEKKNQKLADQLGQYQIRKGDQLKKVSENRLNINEKLLGVRAKVDANRDNRIAKLEARATTTEQKAAVAAFRTTLATITEARRLAVDVAVKAYRENVDQKLATRKSSIETARATLKSAIDALLVKARADCANGVANQTIRVSANTGIKTARQQFATTISGLDKTKAVVKDATEARKTAVTKAQTDFKTAYEKALADLKAAFKS